MAATLEQVTADALALPPGEREQLAHCLRHSLAEENGAPAGASWAEVERRIEEIDKGIETIPAEEVFAKLRGKHG